MLQKKGINIYREVYFWTEMLLNIPQSTDDDLIMIYIIIIYKI